ncbi:MAG: hypothetical protein QMB51_03725 [Patescibacteria group bacterium]
MKKVLINLFLFFSFFFFNIGLNSAMAFNYGLDSVKSEYFGSADVPTVISNVIQIIMGLSATVMLVMILYAGLSYLLSRGDSAKTKKALGLIKTSVIGIIIIVTAYSLSQFIINNIKFIAK